MASPILITPSPRHPTRRLPDIPQNRTVSRAASVSPRPLPSVPRNLLCKGCKACISSFGRSVSRKVVRKRPFSIDRPCILNVVPDSDERRFVFPGICWRSPTFYRNVSDDHRNYIRKLTPLRSYNVRFAPPTVQLMLSGAHTIQEISCLVCDQYLGWKFVRAHQETEGWKDGYYLLELEHLKGSNDAGELRNNFLL